MPASASSIIAMGMLCVAALGSGGLAFWAAEFFLPSGHTAMFLVIFGLLLAMIADPEYQAASVPRTAALADSRLVLMHEVFSG